MSKKRPIAIALGPFHSSESIAGDDSEVPVGVKPEERGDPQVATLTDGASGDQNSDMG